MLDPRSGLLGFLFQAALHSAYLGLPGWPRGESKPVGGGSQDDFENVGAASSQGCSLSLRLALHLIKRPEKTRHVKGLSPHDIRKHSAFHVKVSICPFRLAPLAGSWCRSFCGGV